MRGLLRGSTLIELMVGIAVMGIAVGVLGNVAMEQRRSAAALVERERALQILEAHADLAVRNRAPPPFFARELLETLPGAVLSERKAPGLRVLVLAWRGPSGPRQLELPLVERAP